MLVLYWNQGHGNCHGKVTELQYKSCRVAHIHLTGVQGMEKETLQHYLLFFFVLHKIDAISLQTHEEHSSQHPISPFISPLFFHLSSLMQVWCGRCCVYMASIAQRCRSSSSSLSSSFLALGVKRQKWCDFRPRNQHNDKTEAAFRRALNRFWFSRGAVCWSEGLWTFFRNFCCQPPSKISR